MAEKDVTDSSKLSNDVLTPASTPSQTSVNEDVLYMPLRVFADSHGLAYGVELMAGFYHEQESKQHYADTEENWHKCMKEFMGKEVN